MALQNGAHVFKELLELIELKKKLETESDVKFRLITQAGAAKEKLEAQCLEKDATIAQLKANVTSLRQNVANIKPLEKRLKDKEDSVKSLNSKVLELEKEKQNLVKRLEAERTDKAGLRESHRNTKQKLDRPEGYALIPKPLKREDIAQKLEIIFKSAFDMINTCFSGDLDARYLGTNYWDSFKVNVGKCKAGIPLAPSNSPEAKRMRTAAVLRVLAVVATNQLFQPEYTLARGSELSQALHAQVDDSDRANFVRRVLLQVEPNNPTVGEHIANRVKFVNKCLTNVVRPILAEDVFIRLASDLDRWVQDAVRVWSEAIQPLPQGISVFIDLDETDDAPPAREWVVMAASPEWAASVPATKSSGPARTGSTAGSSSGAERSPAPALAASGPTVNTANVPITSAANVAACIWPVFLMMDKDKSVVRQGFVLTKAQVAKAEQEEKDLAKMPPNSRRMTRVRTNSNIVSPSSPSDVPF
ncbi:hypothetical protein SEUCBS140593_002498 [Sporothrix eucalyptigena]|uniref:MEI5 protein n=1 Tax=Sporothrix eucalyptigena TaxID=1812306 RepID=A0ABP0B6Y6_9PEZI